MKKINLNNLVGKNFIDLTNPHENIFRVIKISVEADLVWVEPVGHYRNMVDSKVFEGKLFKSLVSKNRIIIINV